MKTFIVLGLLVWLNSPVQAFASEKKAYAFCPMTHVMGHGRGASLGIAEDKAIKDCIAKGGFENCCQKFFGEDKA